MPRSQRSTKKKLLASLAILAGVGTFVSYGVFSAFTQTQTNASTLNSAAFGLAQTPSTGLLGTISGLIPGDTITRCVKLENTSDIAVDVTALPSMANTSGTLRDVVTLTLQKVTGIAGTATAADIKSCVGAVDGAYLIGSATAGVAGSALADTTVTGGGAGGSWAPAEVNYYKAVFTLPATVTDAVYAGKTATAEVNFRAVQKSGLAGAK